MKKLFKVLNVAMVMCIICSCSNGGKPQVDEQAIKDSIAKVLKDSMAQVEQQKKEAELAEKERESAVTERLKLFGTYLKKHPYDYAEYATSGFLSKDFEGLVTRYNKKFMSSREPWNIWSLRSSESIMGFTILEISDIAKDTAKARVKLRVTEDEENIYDSPAYSLSLIFENGKWQVDNIDNTKQNLQSAIN